MAEEKAPERCDRCGAEGVPIEHVKTSTDVEGWLCKGCRRVVEILPPAAPFPAPARRLCPLGWLTMIRQNTTPPGLLTPNAPGISEIEQRIEAPTCVGDRCMWWRDDCVVPGVLEALLDIAVGIRIANGEPPRA